MGLLSDGWTRRLVVPIQPTQAGLADFTAVLTDGMLPAAVTNVLFDTVDGALNDGGDLRASVDVNGDTLVGLDLRRWNKAAGEIEIAFRVPVTSAALTTTLYLWWGKDNATQPDAGAVGGRHSAYDDDTIFCAPVGGEANRTAFNITGTDVGGIIAGDIAAPSGLLGTQHTDVGDYSTYGDNPDLDLVNTDWTMSFLFRATTSGQEQYILGKYDHTTQNRGYLCIFSAAQHFDLTYQPVRTSYNPIYRLSSGVDVVDGQWHHLAGTFISGTRASVYTDGILRNTTTNNIPSSVASNGASFQIGTQVTSQNRPADFSHVTVHKVARSAEWLKAENDNFRDSNIFYGTFSAPETVGGAIEVPVTPTRFGLRSGQVQVSKAITPSLSRFGLRSGQVQISKAITPSLSRFGLRTPLVGVAGAIQLQPSRIGVRTPDVLTAKTLTVPRSIFGLRTEAQAISKIFVTEPSRAGVRALPITVSGAIVLDRTRIGFRTPAIRLDRSVLLAPARAGFRTSPITSGIVVLLATTRTGFRTPNATTQRTVPLTLARAGFSTGDVTAIQTVATPRAVAGFKTNPVTVLGGTTVVVVDPTRIGFTTPFVEVDFNVRLAPEISDKVTAAVMRASARTGGGTPLFGTIIRKTGADESVYPPVPGAEVTFPCTVLFVGFDVFNRLGSNVKARDVDLLIAPNAGTTPSNNDRINVNNRVYEINDVKTVQPGGAALLWKVNAEASNG
jgi:hypothetical protein